MLDIRELNVADAEDFELLITHIEKLYGELFGTGAGPSPDDLVQLRRDIATRAPRHWAFLARDDAGEPIALATLAESFAIFARGYYGIINELWVRSDRRRAGAGAAMLDTLTRFGRSRGWRRIDVSAPVDPKWDESFEFYVRQGFVPTGRKLKILLL